jgi:methylmalonyl-CoA mutase C-terminal domain/subunit
MIFGNILRAIEHYIIHKKITPTNTFRIFVALTTIEYMNRPIRVLVAKVGLDGHDRGAKVIASFLRDAGMEVIYTGLRQTPEMVVNAALQEDVDAIGVSILSGAHNTVFPKIMNLMKEKGLNDVLLTGGGIIPDKDITKLNEMGVGRLFPPGTDTSEIIEYITNYVKEHRNF